jgi:hypothetical protein
VEENKADPGQERGESRAKNSAGPKMHSLDLSYSIYA